MLAGNALCSKAKAMYGKRIKDEEYVEFCKKDNVSDLIMSLGNNEGYRNVFKSKAIHSLHREQLEDLLQREYYLRIEKLLKYIPRGKSEYYLQPIRLIEIRIILDKLLNLLYPDSKMNLHLIPAFFNKYIRFDVVELSKVSNLQDFKIIISKLKYNHLLDYEKIESMEQFNNIESSIMELYYDRYVECIKSSFNKTKQKELLEILFTSIELKNIEKIYRLKQYYEIENKELIERISFKYTRLSKEMIDILLKSSKEDFLLNLNKSKYQKYLDLDDFVYIEYTTNKIKYNVAKRFMRFSNNAASVFMTHCILQQIEIDNLKHIIEGIRYNKDASNIESFLIYM